jgi:hypothetical protein
MYLLFFLVLVPVLVLVAGTSAIPSTKVNWADVLSVASVCANALFALLLWLVNRKH